MWQKSMEQSSTGSLHSKLLTRRYMASACCYKQLEDLEDDLAVTNFSSALQRLCTDSVYPCLLHVALAEQG